MSDRDPRPEDTRLTPAGQPLRIVLHTLVLLLWILVGASTMLVLRLLRSSAVYRFPLLFHGFVCRLCGMRVEVHGQPTAQHPAVYVSNHASYLDVFVLGSQIEGAFVAKSEVAGWPLFGKLAKLQNTLFLERNPRRAAEQIEVLEQHLTNGESLILFPEGTSTSGDYVAPFRSSLFAATESSAIQPVSVVYADYEGRPMSATEREAYAWYLPDPKVPVPNRSFVGHFVNALGLGPSRVIVAFHPPLQGGDRKQLAAEAQALVQAGLLERLGDGDQAG
ncbi:MAG: lysophospholipid acyltransferase family protein [Pseudomonadota bacterium]